MDITQFQNDLQSGMTLENALTKHNISLAEAFTRLHYKVNQKTPSNNKYRKQRKQKRYCPTQYIQEWNGRYYLRKSIPVIEKGKPRNKTVQFGTYSSLEDAIKVREAMKDDGWHITHLPRICDELNIRRIH